MAGDPVWVYVSRTVGHRVAYMAQNTAPKPQHRLSQKQIRFVREYAIHGNGAEAVRQAGYRTRSPDVVKQQAAENLTKPYIAAAISELAAKIAPEITPARVQRRLHEISHASQDAGQFGPAVRAEELLGKSVGMWIDQTLQLTGVLNDSHVSALIEIARRRQAEPIDLVDDEIAHKGAHSDRDDG
jgi:D-alanyl-D-alanine dipeptidase